MARLASEAKGGYYATPEKELALALKRIKTKFGKEITILDPCCGEGFAIAQIKNYLSLLGAEPVSYGVELEEGRAKNSQDIVDHVIRGSYEEIRMSMQSVSLLYLNPPYQFKDLGLIKERMERAFLRDLTEAHKHLQDDTGLLMFCIPQHVLKDCASLLSQRFQKLAIYRFTDENYPVYKQVMVYGYRRKIRPIPDEALAIKKRLVEISESGPEILPSLDIDDEVVYNVTPSSQKVEKFRSSIYTEEEIAQVVDDSPLWSKFDEMILPPSDKNAIQLQRFILPPKPVHVAVAINAGVVGGNMGNHYLVGTTKRITEESKDYDDEKDELIITKLRKHVTICRVFNQQGVFTLE